MTKFILLFLLLTPLLSSAQNLEINLGDSMSLLIQKLKIEREYLKINYSHTIHDDFNTVDVEVTDIPDGVQLGGLPIIYKKFTFYKFRLETVLVVLSREKYDSDIKDAMVKKYGKQKMHNTDGDVWVSGNKMIFLSENNKAYSLMYADRKLYYEEQKDASNDL